MSTREALNKILDTLPEERLREVLEFAEFASWREEWRLATRAAAAKFYGPEESDDGELGPPSVGQP